MENLRKVVLTLITAILLGVVCPQARALAAEEETPVAAEEGPPAAVEETIIAEDPPAAVEETIIAEDPPAAVEETIIAEEPPAAAEEETPVAAEEEPATEETAAESTAAQESDEAPITAENGIPVVIIRVDESEGNNTIEEMNASEDHSVECIGTMEIVVPEDFSYCDMDSAAQDLGPVLLEYIRGRGNSTWGVEKKPYKIKLDKKASVLGLSENKHWVLLANVLDETLIRDRFTGWLGDEFGLEFTPNGVPVDVVMVATKDGVEVGRTNLGSYLLAEQVRVDKKRVNIHELSEDETDPEEITGGYLLAYGSQTDDDDPDKFFTDRGLGLVNESPTFDPSDDDYTNEQQKAYIREYIQKMENALYGVGVDDDGSDLFTNSEGIRYNEYMDMESAAKYWLIQELSFNGDGFSTGSNFFYKTADQFDESGNVVREGKIYWGPLWDFDAAWGYLPEYKEFAFVSNDWINAMVYDDDENGFRRTAQSLWPQLKSIVMGAIEEGGIIDQYNAETKSSYDADYDIWIDTIPFIYSYRNDYDTNIEALKDWIRNRVAWIDAHISGTSEDEYPTLDDAVCKVTYVVDGKTALREYYQKGRFCVLYTPGDSDSEGSYIPEKEGHEFIGWIDEDGNQPETWTKVLSDRVFTALFSGSEEPVEPSPGSEDVEPSSESEEDVEPKPSGQVEPGASSEGAASSEPVEPGASSSEPVASDESENSVGESGKTANYKDTTDTGDESNVLLWSILMVVAVAGIGEMVYFRRRRNI